MASMKEGRTGGLVAILGLLGGLLLTVIGIRYFVAPEQAARQFGVPGRPAGYELYYVIGLRNLWLGLLAIAFAALREWRALAIWFTLGTLVCFADAALAATSTGRLMKVAFHLVCGAACAALAVACWRLAAARAR
jgi:hypothetical protein